MEWLESIDRALFLFLNGINSPFWDEVMYWISAKRTWIPLYVALLYPLWKMHGWRLVYLLITVGLLIVFTDQFSVFFKNTIGRYRPCHNLELLDIVHKVNNKCGGKFGFVSSHACNTFGLAFFFYQHFNRHYRWLGKALIVWAVVVSYSRIYLGVHYPADVFCGALLGMLLAFVCYRFIFASWLKRYTPYVND
jgi:undecaprenyl-diphosphatase